MAMATGRAVRTTIVKQDKVDQAMTFLKELPDKPKEDLSLREAVGHLKDSIKDALSKGYSYADLAKMLTDQGIKISTLTLKNYVPSGKRSASKTKGRRTKKAQGEEAGAILSPDAQPEAEAPARRPRRKAKSESVAAEASEPTSTDAAPDFPPTRSTRGRAKSATAAKSRTGSRTRAKQSNSESADANDSTTKAPTRSRRKKASS
jgi:hypothetical protein